MNKLGIKVQAENAGKRIDVFLCEKYSRISRHQWQQRIEKGHVRVNGLICRASRRLNENDLITFEREITPEPETAQQYGIIYEDEDLLVIDKPANLPIHPSGCYRNNTLYSFLRRDFESTKIHFVNRIDRETSGLVLLAKNTTAAKILHQQMKLNQIHKEYLAVVIGLFPEYLNVKGFIGEGNSLVKKKRSFLAQDHPPLPGWQNCHSEFYCLKRDNGLSLLKVKLHTGRRHQIRATLCSLGFPIAGDTLYGVDERMYLKFIAGQITESDWQLLRGYRSMLHAHRIHLQHPRNMNIISLEAPLPADFHVWHL